MYIMFSLKDFKQEFPFTLARASGLKDERETTIITLPMIGRRNKKNRS